MSRKYREKNMRCLQKLLSTYANLLSNEAILQRCLFWLLLNPEQTVISCTFYAARSRSPAPGSTLRSAELGTRRQVWNGGKA